MAPFLMDTSPKTEKPLLNVMHLRLLQYYWLSFQNFIDHTSRNDLSIFLTSKNEDFEKWATIQQIHS
jgi:hypothetical protein